MASPGDEPPAALLSPAEAARIHAQLRTLQPRARPLRLYGTRGGRVVRVLDEHGELSPRTLDAIGRFLEADGDEATDASVGAGDAAPSAVDEGWTGAEKEESVGGRDYRRAAAQEDVDMDATGIEVEAKDEEMNLAQTDSMHGVCDAMEETSSSSSVATVVADANTSPEVAHEPLIATPQQLLDQHQTAEQWLQGGNAIDDSAQPVQERSASLASGSNVSEQLHNYSVSKAIDNSALLTNWPSHLEERRRVWFSAQNRPTMVPSTPKVARTVVYWMHNCFRVENSNFALESAVMLAKRLQTPLTLVTLVRSSVVYPVCHSPTASDAYLRWCLLEINDRCVEANVPFHIMTSTWSSADGSSRSELPTPHEWARHPLFTALDAFDPGIVVTDTPFDATSGGDVTRLAQHMESNQSLSPWTLISVDSSSFIPIHNISMQARASLEPKAPILSEEDFGNEYAAAQAHKSRQGFSTAGSMSCLKMLASSCQVSAQTHRSICDALKVIGLEIVDSEIVRGIAAASNSELPTFTEHSGRKALDTLLAEFDHRPAIQAELQGSGIMSLLPFVRQGSLYSGYILQRISEAVDFFPTPTTPQDRKALAMLKVMRSRALTHLARERDYALYLALWTAAQHRAAEQNPQLQQSTHLTASSALIESLRLSALILSPLDAYVHLLPPWIHNNVRLGVHDGADGEMEQASRTPSYGPYELESGRTQDQYWNAIQRFFVRYQYIHPLLAAYWSYRVLEWSTSSRAGVAMIDALVSKCAIGPPHSPDAVFMIWNALFMRIGASKSDALTDARTFQQVVTLELKSQPKLQLS